MADAPAPLDCRRVVARGLVQGVGFRYACVQQARVLGLTGWVRNRRDGSVEALLQGAPAAVERMCAWMREGDGNPGRIDRLDMMDIEPPFTRHDRFEQAPSA